MGTRVVNPSDVVEEGAVVVPVNAPRPSTGQRPAGPSVNNGHPVTSATRGAADTGGRGASVKGPGQKQ
jgi:hypothetical protein